jgi:hypothetical protein
VTITAGEFTQFNEVRAGSSYLSQNDPRLHFGIGKETSISKVEITWPSGAKQTLNRNFSRAVKKEAKRLGGAAAGRVIATPVRN